MPPPATLVDADKAIAALRASASQRFLRLDMLERYVKGTQYEGREPFFSDGDTPLLERAPYIVFQVVQSAIRSHASMVLGQGRFPSITANPGEDDEEDGGDDDGAGEDDSDDDGAPPSSRKPAKTKPSARAGAAAKDGSGFGLDEEDSATIDRLIRKISKQVKLPLAAAKDLRRAMGCGSSVAIVSVKRGRLCITIAPAKNCEPRRDNPSDPDEVTSLEFKYPYTEEYKNDQGKPALRCKIYRRVIDAQTDTVYHPLDATKDGKDIPLSEWKPKQQVKHALGFCPVRWYKYMADEDGVACPDGHAIHELLLDEITGLDFTVSQRQRAVLYTTDPIITEIGVDAGFSPTSLIAAPTAGFALSPEMAMKLGPDAHGVSAIERLNSQWRQPNRGAGKMGRKRAPGMAYQYPVGATVSFLTLPGDALTASSNWSGELETKLKEWLSWVPLDPEAMTGAAGLSGKALELLLKRQIDYDLEVRTDYGDHGLLPLVDLLLRVAYTIGKDPARRKGLYLDGLDEALPILKRFEREQELAAVVEEVVTPKPPAPGYGQRPELNPRAEPEQAAPAPPTTTTVWMSPEIDLVWPDFFTATAADAKAEGDNVRADLGAGLITKDTAVTKVAPFYGVKDAAAYAKKLEAEAAKATADLHAANALLATPGAAPPGAPGQAPTRPAPAGSPALPQGRKPPPKPAPPVAALPPGRLFGGSRTRNAPAPPVT